MLMIQNLMGQFSFCCRTFNGKPPGVISISFVYFLSLSLSKKILITHDFGCVFTKSDRRPVCVVCSKDCSLRVRAALEIFHITFTAESHHNSYKPRFCPLNLSSFCFCLFFRCIRRIFIICAICFFESI